MQKTFQEDSAHYHELLSRQIEQYKETDIMHDLPPIYDYVAKKYTAKRLALVTGSDGLVGFYGDYFKKSLKESDSNFLISIGAGDCSLEIEIVKYLVSQKESNFFFVCLELSPFLIEKARKKIESEALSDVITVVQTDINEWSPKFKFAGVMAHHSLHHFLNLEELFQLIKENLARKGRFLTCDIIGRNGHMRWPEALVLTRKIWEKLPRKYKFHHLFNKYDDYFNNWDCSVEGFEGIRAQDILPLLVNTFSFEIFFCHGNLIDPFIDRAFGPNYNPDDAFDASVVDWVHDLNDKLISDDILKPTSMTAVMVNEKVESPKIFKDWSPSFAIRDPKAIPPNYELEPLLENMPVKSVEKEQSLTFTNSVEYYTLNERLTFGGNIKSASSGQKFLRYGWSDPEDSDVWSICEDASVVFPLNGKIVTDLNLILEFIPYLSPLYEETVVNILVNGEFLRSLYFNSADRKTKSERFADLLPKYQWLRSKLIKLYKSEGGKSAVINIPIPLSITLNEPAIELRFLFPNRRQPQFESGNDVRALGIALISAVISS